MIWSDVFVEVYFNLRRLIKNNVHYVVVFVCSWIIRNEIGSRNWVTRWSSFVEPFFVMIIAFVGVLLVGYSNVWFKLIRKYA